MNVALRGDDGDVGEAVEAAGGTLVAEPDAADVVVAVGEAAVSSLGGAGFSTPILPVGFEAGPHAIARPAVPAALETLAAGSFETAPHPVVSVSIDDEPVAQAVLDAMLVTTEPARISGYAVADAFGRLDTFRADGVVAATPLGSGGYASAAGGSVLGPWAGLSVVPVSPYETETDSWALSPPVVLSVERDDSPVSLFVDGDAVGPVDTDVPVRLDHAADLTLVSVPSLD